jgi:UDP-N-acetylglucosamine 2-epimerase (non-hydrolysing)/GDP/UDP-N,N'-diacetylbacillosamine 2-epimerase (hydrolysing)
MRKICVVTGSRAEYGLLYWLMKEIQADADLQLQIIATGMHLSPEFGLTHRSIEEDGFTIDAKVEMLLSSDTPVGIAKSIGLGVIGFADALERLKPDIMVVLGDRYEILAAAQAALVAKIPLAHISGGEKTEGALDEAVRHSLTKMAHLHFVAAEPYRLRVIQLGENPARVFNFGDPGLDNINRLKLLDLCELEKSLSFSLGIPYFLITYHPVTLGNEDPAMTMSTLFRTLEYFPEAKVIITKPNSDTGGRILIGMIDDYCHANCDRVYVSTSLGQIRYLSALKHCSVVIGNSSSGIVEAPAMKKPTVNIGRRQSGRLKASSIIDCNENANDIQQAIKTALSPGFQQELQNVKSLYGDGNTSSDIKECLKTVELRDIHIKRFYDIDVTCTVTGM